MIPIRDDTPSTRTPIVTYAVIGICVAVFLVQQSQTVLDEPFSGLAEEFAMVPARVMGAELPLRVTLDGRLIGQIGPAAVPDWLTLLTCTFLHGGWLHLIGNLWILWIFGDNVEERLGRVGYVFFYLGCGAAASLTHLLSQPDSPIPTVGASGAIAGVMGAYLLLHPHAKVLTLVPLGFLLQMVVLPAWVFLGIWFVLQLFSGTFDRGGAAGVAWWAHIGGFAVGAAIVGGLRAAGRLRPEPPRFALRGQRFGRRGPPGW